MASHEIPDITNPAVNQPALPGFEQLAEQAATPIIDPALLAVSIREAFRRGVDQATRPQEPPRENLFDEARQEAMENGSGMSAFVARAKLSGMPAEQLDKAVLDERGDMIRRAASGANAKAKGPKKPRGRSYPQDESRADDGFNQNPTPQERAELMQPEEGMTYTGAGLGFMHKQAVINRHNAAMRATQGSSVTQQTAVELARLDKLDRENRHNQAS